MKIPIDYKLKRIPHDPAHPYNALFRITDAIHSNEEKYTKEEIQALNNDEDTRHALVMLWFNLRDTSEENYDE